MTHSNDHQVGGHHYTSKEVQPWDAMQSWMSPEAFAGYLQGNCIKYLARYRDKNGIEDLKKAQHYLSKLIEVDGSKKSAAIYRHAFEAGHQSGLTGGEINNAFRATMHKDWIKGYEQGRKEFLGDRHKD